MNPALEGIAPLTHMGVLRAQGADAAPFLQGQLTQDVVLLAPPQACLAAYCTPKGRMLASFIGIKRAADDVLLIIPRDTLAATLKRLSMFVLRAKVRLSDASADFDLYGLAGGAAQALLPADSAPGSGVYVGEAHAVALYPADGQARALWVAPAGTAPPAGAPLAPAQWAWGEVRSGVVLVGAAVSEAFVPQMLNYESVGGVSFKKGCYPGQEVVARSQFRGTLKRRAYVAHSAVPLQAGQEIFQAADTEQPVGLVVQAAAAPAGGFDAVVSLQVAVAEGGALHTGAADAGAELTLQPLPYALKTDL